MIIIDKISINDSIFNIVTRFPRIKQIMVELGFKDIVMPGMLGSVGRIMTLKKGSSIKHIPFESIVKIFEENEFELVEEKI